MKSVAARREEAFGELYRSHLSAIAAYASRRAAAEDAVDVVAETFLVCWRRFDDLPEGPAVRPWLYGVARRVLANQRRGELRRHALHDRICSEWIQVHVADEPADLSSLVQALEALSESDRDILLLVGVEELKPAEIAVVLDVSPEIARNRLSRARARLREAHDEIRTGSGGHVLSESTDESQ